MLTFALETLGHPCITVDPFLVRIHCQYFIALAVIIIWQRVYSY